MDHPELTAESFTEWAKEQGIELRFIHPGKPNQNTLIERFKKSFREEVLNANLFNSIAEAQEAVEVWLTDYNEYRPHESLGDVPSAMFTLKADLPPASRTNVKFVKSVTMENDDHEEEQIYRRTDHWVLAASQSRHADQGVVPQRRI